MILIYITNPSIDEAKKIATHLLTKKLIACANIFDNVTSIYPWENKIVEDKEVILIVKSVENKFDEIKKEVAQIHSYDIPCIVKISADANQKYFDWVSSVVE